MSAEAAPVFIDTNVLVYAYDASAGAKAARAAALIRELWESGGACLSIQVLQEFFVTITRKVPAPLEPRKAAQIVEDLTRWRVHSPESDDVLEAIDVHLQSRISFWDALIIRSARQLGCREILSEDLSPGEVHPGVKVRNPFAA